MDNAADNKSRWCLGFFAWLILQGWVKEISVSMMMVGHTHEDIDAVFKRIVEEWRRRGKVLSPDEFYQLMRDAVSGALVTLATHAPCT